MIEATYMATNKHASRASRFQRVCAEDKCLREDLDPPP